MKFISQAKFICINMNRDCRVFTIITNKVKRQCIKIKENDYKGERKIMASFKKDNNTVEVPRGIYKGIIIDFKSKGLKKIKKGYVFESGYLEILLDNGVVLSQYVIVSPYENWIFYRIVEAIGLSNKIDEYID